MIKLLITDLDDTLYSWIGFFIPAFYEMVNELSSILKKDKKELLREYKLVHQEKGSVEYPYATTHLPSVQAAYPNYTQKELLKILDPVFHRFNSSRKKNLRLYPNVQDTLTELWESGVRIVGYTESAEENGFYRLRKLGIDNLFCKVYVSDSQYENPNSMVLSEKTEVVHGKKPAPELLEQICKSECISTSEAIYVGDSLTKDIYMAKIAHITSILCKYPCDPRIVQELYQKLVAISHWTAIDFEQEQKLKEICFKDNIQPDYTITSFDNVIKIVQELNETDINPPAELGKLADASSDKQSPRIKTPVV